MDESPRNPRGARIAIDLGATSGRIMLATADGHLREASRFLTPLLRLEKGIFWDFPTLMQSIVQGLSRLTADDGPFLSLSCDSWAQDFGLLNAEGKLLELPYSYRDTQSEIHSRPRLEFIQSRRPELYSQAVHLLHIADLVHYELCGAIRSNYSLVAISKLPLDHPLLGQLADAEVIGTICHPALPSLRGVPIISGVGHDTAAAYLSSGIAEHEAFISLGTWYMAAAPCSADATMPPGFSFLPLPGRKLARTCGGMGMWSFSQCVALWKTRGDFSSYEAISAAAEAADAPGELDLQNPALFSPDNMEEAIWQVLGYQATPPQITKLLFEGLARTLGDTIRKFQEPFRKVVLGGGPCANPYLRKLIQAKLDCPLVAGQQEATTFGNILVQRQTLP